MLTMDWPATGSCWGKPSSQSRSDHNATLPTGQNEFKPLKHRFGTPQSVALWLCGRWSDAVGKWQPVLPFSDWNGYNWKAWLMQVLPIGYHYQIK